MKPWMFVACSLCVMAGLPCHAADSVVDDDEYEEVVIRRKKKRSVASPRATVVPTVVVAPAAVAPVAAVMLPSVGTVSVAAPQTSAAPAAEAGGEPPPPPEPPAAEAAEPRRLVRYFCKAWKDKDWERCWWAMSPQYRKQVALKKFTKLFESDAELNGGLVDENVIEAAKTRDGNEGVKVELMFKFPRAKHRFVMAVAERQPGGAFRIVDSPFIPQDLDDL